MLPVLSTVSPTVLCSPAATVTAAHRHAREWCDATLQVGCRIDSQPTPCPLRVAFCCTRLEKATKPTHAWLQATRNTSHSANREVGNVRNTGRGHTLQDLQPTGCVTRHVRCLGEAVSVTTIAQRRWQPRRRGSSSSSTGKRPCCCLPRLPHGHRHANEPVSTESAALAWAAAGAE